MKIQLGSFYITDCTESITRFDLHEVRVIEKGKMKGQLRDEPFAFGLKFERACQVIAQKRAERQLKDVTFDKFLKEYKVINENLITEVKAALSWAEKQS